MVCRASLILRINTLYMGGKKKKKHSSELIRTTYIGRIVTYMPYVSLSICSVSLYLRFVLSLSCIMFYVVVFLYCRIFVSLVSVHCCTFASMPNDMFVFLASIR